MTNIYKTVEKLACGDDVTDAELEEVLAADGDEAEYLRKAGAKARERVYGDGIFIRGLIEISSICRNDCLYCGIRRSNRAAQRYRLDADEILECAKIGYTLGFRTFVLQGGEDLYFTDERLSDIVTRIKKTHPDVAVTLSVGERSRESYAKLREAGADRYLLRHETAAAEHYASLHPPELTLENRMRCLRDLKELGYQTGCGFMVGTPGQTLGHIVRDLRFIKSFEPHMVGVGPFIPHKDTPLRDCPTGSTSLTLNCLAVLRLMNPELLLPATTALGTAASDGQLLGILAGANVVMPNLSPAEVRGKYLLYNNKLATGIESAEGLGRLDEKLRSIGCHVTVSRGDCINFKNNK